MPPATQPQDPTETTPSSPRNGQVVARTPRSRVGKRKVLLSGIDTHSRTYLEYRDVVADLADHLGSAPTVVQRAIIEEAAGLVVWCRKARLALLKGEEFNVGTYTTATNALRRLLADIGQEALLKDVTPDEDVETYCASPEHKLASAPQPEPEVAPSIEVEPDSGVDCQESAA